MKPFPLFLELALFGLVMVPVQACAQWVTLQAHVFYRSLGADKYFNTVEEALAYSNEVAQTLHTGTHYFQYSNPQLTSHTPPLGRTYINGQGARYILDATECPLPGRPGKCIFHPAHDSGPAIFANPVCPQEPEDFLMQTQHTTEETIAYCIKFFKALNEPKTCSRDALPPAEGNPVVVLSGEKIQHEVDFEDPLGLLDFNRTYRAHTGRFHSLIDQRLFQRRPLLSRNPQTQINAFALQPRVNISYAGAVHHATERIELEWPILEVQHRDPLNNSPIRSPLDPPLPPERYLQSSSGYLETVDGPDTLIRVLREASDTEPYTLLQRADNALESYDAKGRLVHRALRGSQQHVNFEYANDLLIRQTDNFGRSMDFFYNESRQLVAMRAPGGALYRYSWSNDGLLQSVQYPDGHRRQYRYDEPLHINHGQPCSEPLAAGLLSSLIDERGQVIGLYHYDCEGRVTRTEGSQGLNAHSFTYASGGVQSTSPANLKTSYQSSQTHNYRVLNRVCKQPGSCANWIFDNQANLIQFTDSSNTTTLQSHDTERNLVQDIIQAHGSPDAQRTSITWHPQWRLPMSIVQDDLRKIQLNYDDSGKHTATHITDLKIGTTQSWKFHYNSNGFLSKETDPLGYETLYEYDASGHLSAITDPQGQKTLYTHDPVGRINRIVYPDGVEYSYAYSARGQLTSISVQAGGQAYNTRIDYTPSAKMNTLHLPNGLVYYFDYDVADRLIGWKNNRGESMRLELDNAGRLIARALRDAQGRTVWQQRDHINPLGQVEKIELGEPGQGSFWQLQHNHAGELTVATNGLGQRTRFSYDRVGRLITSHQDGAGPTDLRYDKLNAVVQAHDGKNVTTHYTRDAQGNALTETSPDIGTDTNSYDLKGLTASSQDATGRTQTITRDALGRPVSIRHGQGESSVTSTFVYE